MNINIDKDLLVKRFINFVKVDTTADPKSTTYPSTLSQLTFADSIVDECINIGLSNVKKDSYGYVTATLPSNIEDSKSIPIIGFLAHMDTSPAASGKNIKPNIINCYNGGDINLSNKVVLSPKEFPDIKQYIGEDIITTDGTTLLGADNKAGIAEIITAMEFLINNPTIKHGTIRVGFTPDEEIGKGVDYFNIEEFNANFAYTIDGGKLGELENESFNAASAVINITGKSVHPGSAKDVLVNANLIATEIANMFPKDETPETTEGYEGFYFLDSITGGVEHATLNYIIRDHNKEFFENRKKFVKNLVKDFNNKYNNVIDLELKDQYYNMREVIDKYPHVMDLAYRSMQEIGIEPIIKPIRGGTDGSRLSFMGLPCPNIFAGGHNFHGPYEYIPINSMVKACEVIITICNLNSIS